MIDPAPAGGPVAATPPNRDAPAPWFGWLLLVVLVVDAVALALIGLFYLPLRAPAEFGGWPFPIVVALGAVLLPMLVSAAARYGPAPSSALAPVAAWLVTVIAFGIVGPGGDRVLLGDWRALALLGAGLLPAAVVLGRQLTGGATTLRVR